MSYTRMVITSLEQLKDIWYASKLKNGDFKNVGPDRLALIDRLGLDREEIRMLYLEKRKVSTYAEIPGFVPIYTLTQLLTFVRFYPMATMKITITIKCFLWDFEGKEKTVAKVTFRNPAA